MLKTWRDILPIFQTLSVNDLKRWIKTRSRKKVLEWLEEEAAGSPKTCQGRAFPWFGWQWIVLWTVAGAWAVAGACAGAGYNPVVQAGRASEPFPHFPSKSTLIFELDVVLLLITDPLPTNFTTQYDGVA